MVDDLQSIGRRISELRRMKNLSQKELAAKLNISNNHLSNIENGKSAPGFQTFLDICRILNADATYIVAGVIYPSIDDEIAIKYQRKNPENKIIISKIIDSFPDQTKT